MNRSTLDAARAGDEQAFRELTAPYLVELHVHCYRMLGSLVDAEDLLQETLAAAWRGLKGFVGRSSLRTWLYRIATNRCLNAVRDAKRRRPAEPIPPFDPPEPSRQGEVTWLQPYPDAWLEQIADMSPGPAERYQARETIELAFIAALQRLPPRQTAALLPVMCSASRPPRSRPCSTPARPRSRARFNAPERRSTATAPPPLGGSRRAPALPRSGSSRGASPRRSAATTSTASSHSHRGCVAGHAASAARVPRPTGGGDLSARQRRVAGPASPPAGGHPRQYPGRLWLLPA